MHTRMCILCIFDSFTKIMKVTPNKMLEDILYLVLFLFRFVKHFREFPVSKQFQNSFRQLFIYLFLAPCKKIRKGPTLVKNIKRIKILKCPVPISKYR